MRSLGYYPSVEIAAFDDNFRALPRSEQFDYVVRHFIRTLDDQSYDRTRETCDAQLTHFLESVARGKLQAAREDFLGYGDVDQVVNCFLLDLLEPYEG